MSRTIVKKEKERKCMKPSLKLHQQVQKPCNFCKIVFNLILKVQHWYKKGTPIDSNMIQEKTKSLCDNVKQKEGEGFKAKDGLIILERGLILKMSR